MPAAQENRIKSVSRLAIIAGGGALPAILMKSCDDQNIETFVVGIEGQVDPALLQGRDHMWTRIGNAGTVIKTLKSKGLRDMVLIGSLKRPSLADVRPDLKTLEFFARISLKAIGDNSLLNVLRNVLEEDGFIIHGVHEFVDNLLAPAGVIGRAVPAEEDWLNIRHGFEISQKLGLLDIGQAVIVQEGIVLGVEAVEGTDALIQRCGALKRKGRGGVLVKTCKPQQDRHLDLPTIGPETVRRAAEAGLSGIAVHAGQALIVDLEQVAKTADDHKMFVIGVAPV